MIKSSITLSLFPSSPKMPFVLGPDLEQGVAQAAEMGYDALELFPPSREAIDNAKIKELCITHAIEISTVGTGGGWVADKLSFTDPDAGIRRRAIEYARSLVAAVGDLGGMAIIGSMQGRVGQQSREEAIARLSDALNELGEYARKWEQPLLYEPLNRYETDLISTLGEAGQLLDAIGNSNVKLLADLFHMNIEEVDVPDAIRAAANHIGHVHFVDSNRWPAGFGHTRFAPIAGALKEIGYDGYVAMEVFPLPTQREAAHASINAFKKWFR